MVHMHIVAPTSPSPNIDAVKIHAMQQHEMLEIVILTNDVTSHHWTNSSNGDDVIQTTYIHHGI